MANQDISELAARYVEVELPGEMITNSLYAAVHSHSTHKSSSELDVIVPKRDDFVMYNGIGIVELEPGKEYAGFDLDGTSPFINSNEELRAFLMDVLI